MHYFIPLLVMLCFSMHACHIGARNARLGQEKTVRNMHSFDKEVVQNEAKPDQIEASTLSRLRPFLSDELRAQNQVERTRTVNREHNVQLRDLSKSEDTKNQREASGIENTISTIKTNSDPAIEAKAMRKQERLLLGAAHQDTKEFVDAHHNNLGDITEMDYAQPHRKPPIHNEKP